MQLATEATAFYFTKDSVKEFLSKNYVLFKQGNYATETVVRITDDLKADI